MTKINTSKDEEVLAYEPGGQIKQVLSEGFQMGTHLTKERVDACQGILDEAARAFFDHGLEDVVALEALLASHSPEHVDDNFFTRVQSHAHNLRGQSQILGFTLITKISGHMIESIALTQVTDAKKYRLVQRITEVLHLAFAEKIQDAGGPKGVELLALIESYLASQQ